MGRDKSRLRLGRRTLTGHVKATVRKLGLKTRVVRTDTVLRCGPIGGILTALEASRADLVLVLACDMPFVSEGFLRKVIGAFRNSDGAVFAFQHRRDGFPLLMRREECLPIVRRQIERRTFSLQKLARALRARRLTAASADSRDLVNINTPQELQAARLRRLR